MDEHTLSSVQTMMEREETYASRRDEARARVSRKEEIVAIRLHPTIAVLPLPSGITRALFLFRRTHSSVISTRKRPTDLTMGRRCKRRIGRQ